MYGFITASHGGIYVYSEQNIGTSFKIYLPRDKGSENDLLVTSDQTLCLSGTENILVVDDETALRELAKTILEAKGYTVHLANSADQALSSLKSKKIDLMISDVIMPKVNGYQLIEKVNSLELDLPILLVSGFDGEIAHSTQHLKKTPLISKPYTSYDLLSHVRTLLDNKVVAKS